MANSSSSSDKSSSVSRGHEPLQSSGRGGLGNIRRAFISSNTRPFDGPDDFDLTRRREQAVHPDRMQMKFSVGRGGAGNMRSQTTTIRNEHAGVQADYEQHVKKHHAESNLIRSSGRGGLGNISDSRSRSRCPMVHSTGRGGAGNIKNSAATSVDNMDEEERKTRGHAQAIYSVGRGGAADLTNLHLLDIEREVNCHSEFGSSERDGAGNIHLRSVIIFNNYRVLSQIIGLRKKIRNITTQSRKTFLPPP
ncbi:hypothetical protein BDR07DRAFT_1612949 [Suillus spraguei]|nr:hypothetical protein BDR07DRAFT_1612949 [Suillus spraguei]